MILLLRLFEENGFSETSSAFKREYQNRITENSIYGVDVDWRGEFINRDIDNFNHIPHSRILELLPDLDHGLLRVTGMGVKRKTLNSLTPPLPPRDYLSLLAFYGADRLKKLCSIQGHLVPVFCIVFDGTGTRIFTGGDDNLVKVWDVKTGLLLRTIRAHKTVVGNDPGVIVDLAINQQNTLLATSSSDKTIRIWDMCTFEPLDRIVMSKPITTIEFSKGVADESPLLLLVTVNDSKVRIYQEESNTKGVFKKEPITINAGTLLRDQVSTISIDSAGFLMAAAGGDGIVYMFSLLDSIGTCVGTFESHIAPVTEVVLSLSGFRMVSGCKDGRLVFYQLSIEICKWMIKHQVLIKPYQRSGPETEGSVNRNPPGSVLEDQLTDPTFDQAYLREESNGVLADDAPIRNSTENAPPNLNETGNDAKSSAEVVNVAFNCSESVVISSSADFIIRTWDFEQGVSLQTLIGHTSGIVILEAHPSIDTLLLSGCLEGNLFLWNIVSGEKLYSYKFMVPILSGLFSPCGEFFSVSDAKGLIHIFGLAFQEELYRDSLAEQFGLADWNAVIENNMGQLMDSQSNTLAHLEPLGEITDRNRIPYPVKPKWSLLQAKDFHSSNSITRMNSAIRALLWNSQCSIFRKLIGSARKLVYCSSSDIYSVDDTKKKDLLKRRRQVIKSEGTNNPASYDQTLDFLSIPMVLPDSSGDEYSGDSDRSDGISDGFPEEEFAATPEDFDFVLDTGVINRQGLQTERIHRQRKRTRASGIISDSSIEVDEVSHAGRKRVRRIDIKPGFFRIEDSEEDDSILMQLNGDRPVCDDPVYVDPVNIPQSPRPQNRKKSVNCKVDPPAWLCGHSSETKQYIPQIGDIVVYLKADHREFLNSVRDSSIQYESADDLSALPESLLGKVLSIDYFTAGLEVGCKVALSMNEFIAEDSLYNWKHIASIELMLGYSSCPDFLVLAALYFDSLKNSHAIGDYLIGRFSDGDHRVVVKDVIADSVWSKYTVAFVDDKGTEEGDSFRMSPWELRIMETEWLQPPKLEEKDVERLDSIIAESIESSSGNLDIFLEPVPYEQYPTYLLLVAYPLHIGLLRKRLHSGYYRQLEVSNDEIISTDIQHFDWEWDQMCKNVFLYNDSSALVYRLAKKYLCPVFHRLKGESMESNSASPIQRSGSESDKKSKPEAITSSITEKEEIIEVTHFSRKPGLRTRISMMKKPKARRSGRQRKSLIEKLNESSDEYEEEDEEEDDEDFQESEDDEE